MSEYRTYPERVENLETHVWGLLNTAGELRVVQDGMIDALDRHTDQIGQILGLIANIATSLTAHIESAQIVLKEQASVIRMQEQCIIQLNTVVTEIAERLIQQQKTIHDVEKYLKPMISRIMERISALE